MKKLIKSMPIVSTAAAVSILMSGGFAVAQDAASGASDKQAYETKAQNMNDAYKKKAGDEARRLQGNFGVEELNDIEDWKIVNNGEDLGSIDRIGVDRKTGELLAIVGLEGTLGLNMKEVAIPLKSLKKAGEESLSTTMTKEQLQMKRDIDPWDGTFSQVLDKTQ